DLPKDVALTGDIKEAVAGADLVILSTDHPQYGKLSQRDLGDVPVYDGRGILDRAKFGRFASIGRHA
ncbi:MAG: nucleotide sugar dehydrogenase, partial [Nitrososphaera sp.]